MARPTHILTVKRKTEGDEKSVTNKIGVAWESKEGWFSIKLDACVVLTDRDDVWINLYPNNRPTKSQDEAQRSEQSALGPGAPGSDEPPF